MKRSTRAIIVPSFMAVLLSLAWLTRAGDVNPPGGPVGDTYPSLGFKTLFEAEPRTPVQRLPGSATAVHRIAQSGSYYLTANIVAPAGRHAIEIAADDVTVDLNGFQLRGQGSPGWSGVFVESVGGPYVSIAVVNGSVRGWNGAGIDLQNASNTRVERIRAFGGGGAGVAVGANSAVVDCHTEANFVGIVAGELCVIRGCIAQFNLTGGIAAGSQGAVSGCAAEGNQGPGFSAGAASTFINCTSRNNFLGKGGAPGFQVDDGATFDNCTAEINTGDGFAGVNGCTFTGCSAKSNGGVGIVAFDDAHVGDCNASGNGFIGVWINGGTVAHCTVDSNVFGGVASFGLPINVVGCDVSRNGDVGIYLDAPGRVEGCNVVENGGHGIRVFSDAVVMGNNCAANGLIVLAAGILVVDSDNRIEGNTCTDANRGIDVDGAGNIVIRNTCSGNATNWEIAPGNAVAPIVQATTNAAAINGNTYAGSLGNTDPNANFTY